MYKVKNGLCPLPVQNIFTLKDNNRSLRNNENGENWVIPKVRTARKGIEKLRYRGPLTWNLLPDDIKSAETLEIFHSKISEWKPLGCKCRLCKTYVKDFGFLN